MFPHEDLRAAEYGRSPGTGTTPALLSAAPLATEGEATPGRDDVNPFERNSLDASLPRTDPDPTAGDDPFVFDDVAEEIEAGLTLPETAGPPDIDLRF